MYTGKILVYHFNDLSNAKKGVDRNIHTIHNINVDTKEAFRSAIADSLDLVPPGKGYVLVHWSGRNFICEKDLNNPNKDYVRREVNYHPLLTKFNE